MCCSIAKRFFHFQHDLATVAEFQSVVGNRWAGNITAQPLEFLTLIRFTAQRCSSSGKWITFHLFRTGDVAIKRHIKIRADANPFDTAWLDYFDTRAKRTKVSPKHGGVVFDGYSSFNY